MRSVNQPRGKFQSKHFDNVLTFDENCTNYLKKHIPFRSVWSPHQLKNQSSTQLSSTHPNSNNHKMKFQVSIRDVLTPSSASSYAQKDAQSAPPTSTPHISKQPHPKPSTSSIPHHSTLPSIDPYLESSPPQLFTISGKALLKAISIFVHVVETELLYQYNRLATSLIQTTHQTVHGSVNEQGLFTFTSAVIDIRDVINNVSTQIQLDCQPYSFLKELYYRANCATIDEGRLIYQRMLFHFAPTSLTTPLYLSPTPSSQPQPHKQHSNRVDKQSSKSQPDKSNQHQIPSPILTGHEKLEINLSTPFYPFFQDLDHIQLYLPPFTFKYLQQYGQNLISPWLMKNLQRLPQSPFFFQKAIFCKAVGIKHVTTSTTSNTINSTTKASNGGKDCLRTVDTLHWDDIDPNAVITFENSNTSHNFNDSSYFSPPSMQTQSPQFPYEPRYYAALQAVEGYKFTLQNEQKRLHQNTKLIYPSKKSKKCSQTTHSHPPSSSTHLSTSNTPHNNIANSNNSESPSSSLNPLHSSASNNYQEDSEDRGWVDIDLPMSFLETHFPSTTIFSTHPSLQAAFSATISETLELVKFAIQHSSEAGIALLQNLQQLTHNFHHHNNRNAHLHSDNTHHRSHNDIILAVQLNTPPSSLPKHLLDRLLLIDQPTLHAIRAEYAAFPREPFQQMQQSHTNNSQHQNSRNPHSNSILLLDTDTERLHDNLHSHHESISSPQQPITPTKTSLPSLFIPTTPPGRKQNQQQLDPKSDRDELIFHHNSQSQSSDSLSAPSISPLPPQPLSPTSHYNQALAKSTQHLDLLAELQLPPPTPQTCSKYSQTLSIMLTFAKRFFHDELPVARINTLLDFLFVNFALHPRSPSNTPSTLFLSQIPGSNNGAPSSGHVCTAENIDLVPRTLCLDKLAKLVYVPPNMPIIPSEPPYFTHHLSDKVSRREMRSGGFDTSASASSSSNATKQKRQSTLQPTPKPPQLSPFAIHQQQMSKLIALLLHHPLLYLAIEICIDSTCTHQVLREACFNFISQVVEYASTSQLQYLLFNTPLFHPRTIFQSGHSDSHFSQFYANLWKSMNNLTHELLTLYFKYLTDIAFLTLPASVTSQFMAEQMKGGNGDTNHYTQHNDTNTAPFSNQTPSSTSLPPLANNIFYTLFTRNLFALCRNVDQKWSTIASLDQFQTPSTSPSILSSLPPFQPLSYFFSCVLEQQKRHQLQSTINSAQYTPGSDSQPPLHSVSNFPPPHGRFHHINQPFNTNLHHHHHSSPQSRELQAKLHYQQLDWSNTQYHQSINKQYPVNPLTQTTHLFTILPFLLFSTTPHYIYKYLAILHHLGIFNYETILAILSLEFNFHKQNKQFYFLQFYTVAFTWIFNHSGYTKYTSDQQVKNTTSKHSDHIAHPLSQPITQPQLHPLHSGESRSDTNSPNPLSNQPLQQTSSATSTPLQAQTSLNPTPTQSQTQNQTQSAHKYGKSLLSAAEIIQFHPLSSNIQNSSSAFLGPNYFLKPTSTTAARSDLSELDQNDPTAHFTICQQLPQFQPILAQNATLNGIIHELITNTPYRFDFGLTNWALSHDQNRLEHPYDKIKLQFNLQNGGKAAQKALLSALFPQKSCVSKARSLSQVGSQPTQPLSTTFLHSFCGSVLKSIFESKQIITSKHKLTLEVPNGSLIYQQSTVDIIHDLIGQFRTHYGSDNQTHKHSTNHSNQNSFQNNDLQISSSSSISNSQPGQLYQSGSSTSLTGSHLQQQQQSNLTLSGSSSCSSFQPTSSDLQSQLPLLPSSLQHTKATHPTQLSQTAQIENNLKYLIRYIFSIDPKVVQVYDPNSKVHIFKQPIFSLCPETKKIVFDDDPQSAVTPTNLTAQTSIGSYMLHQQPNSSQIHDSTAFTFPDHADQHNDEFKPPRRAGRARVSHKTPPLFSLLKTALSEDSNNLHCGENSLFILSDQEEDDDDDDVSGYNSNGDDSTSPQLQQLENASKKYLDFALMLFHHSMVYANINTALHGSRDE